MFIDLPEEVCILHKCKFIVHHVMLKKNVNVINSFYNFFNFFPLEINSMSIKTLHYLYSLKGQSR